MDMVEKQSPASGHLATPQREAGACPGCAEPKCVVLRNTDKSALPGECYFTYNVIIIKTKFVLFDESCAAISNRRVSLSKGWSKLQAQRIDYIILVYTTMRLTYQR